jgi:hypothetical protein
MLSAQRFNLQQAGARCIETSKEPKGRRRYDRGAEGFGSAASKPAPFAEKKNAKDAAPAKSIRDAIAVRCDAEG